MMSPWFSLASFATLALADAPSAPPPHVAETGCRSGHAHLQLDTAATWGIGGQMFLGTNLQLSALFEHWATTKVLGTWDLGVVFAYQNEAIFLAPWLDAEQITGANHRIILAARVGHTLHMGQRRRFSVGLHAYAGLNHWRSAYSVRYEAEDVSGKAELHRSTGIVGGELRLGYRFHRNVGAHVLAGAPLPTHSSYVISLAQLGLGLSFYLR